MCIILFCIKLFCMQSSYRSFVMQAYTPCVPFYVQLALLLMWAWHQDTRGSFCHLCSLWFIYCAIVGCNLQKPTLFCRDKASFVPTLDFEAVRCQVVSAHTHKQANMNRRHVVVKMKRNYCLFCCSVAGTEYRHLCRVLQPTTEQLSNSEQ